MEKPIQGFVNFIREQGVLGLAIGFVLGAGVAKLVTAFVTDIINPLVGMMLGSASGLREATVKIGSATIAWGDFISTLIDFVIVAFIIYATVKILKLEKLHLKK